MIRESFVRMLLKSGERRRAMEAGVEAAQRYVERAGQRWGKKERLVAEAAAYGAFDRLVASAPRVAPADGLDLPRSVNRVPSLARAIRGIE